MAKKDEETNVIHAFFGGESYRQFEVLYNEILDIIYEKAELIPPLPMVGILGVLDLVKKQVIEDAENDE